MLPGAEYNLPRQFPSNKAISELIIQSPHLLKTKFAYFLSIVLKNNDIDLLDFLLSQEESFKQTGLKELILQSVELGKIKIINHLLMKGISANIQNDNGETLLHIAASKGDVEIVKILLLYQANCSILTKDNLSPYDYALEQGSKKVIDLLKQHKCNSMIIKGILNEEYIQDYYASNNTNNINNNVYKIKQYKYISPKSERERIGTNSLKQSLNSENFNDDLIPYAIIHSSKNDICEDDGYKYNVCDKSQVYINDVKEFYTLKKSKNNDDLFNYEDMCFKIHKHNNEHAHAHEHEHEININNQMNVHLNNSNDYSLRNKNISKYIKENEDIVQQQLPSKRILENINARKNKNHYLISQTVPKDNDVNKNLYSQSQYYSHQIEEANIEPLCTSLYNKQIRLSNGTNNELILTDKKKEVHAFLDEIKLSKYTQLMIDNGFDDIQLIIEQTRLSISITDDNLRDAGIRLPGDRAKILIRLEEKAKLFDFTFNKENLYYKPNNIAMNKNDSLIQSLYRFLTTIKLEHYLNNFIASGYHSPELILIQMLSRQPITEYTLQYEIKIDKIGYRSRMLNKFREEAKSYVSRIKNGNVLIESQKGASDFCNGCLIV